MEALRQRAALARHAPAAYARLVLLGELGDRLEPVKEPQAA
jgi:hypothetical protein